MSEKLARATLAAGCFWCVEAVFSRLEGVEEVVSGYTGGKVENPDYSSVCSGETGHAEAVQITFDPQVVSFAELLDIFWRFHDPTTLNRQGADVGTQYRSAIFYHDEEQRQTAEQSRAAVAESGLWPDPIVTEIVPAEPFYPAEDGHQDYYRRNGLQPFCQAVIAPKIRRLEKDHADRLQQDRS